MATTKTPHTFSIHIKLDLPKKQASRLIDSLLENTKKTVASDGDLLISGSGEFCLKYKKTKVGGKPKTGEDSILDSERAETSKGPSVLRKKVVKKKRKKKKEKRFESVKLGHMQQAPWSKITHLKLKRGISPDTGVGHRILDHISPHADSTGIAELIAIQPGFPARLQKNLSPLENMRRDLRHMANERDSGYSSQDKGLIELGWLV